MKREMTKYGWKTETTLRKQYHVKYIGKLMLVDTWIEVDERLFPNRSKSKKCEFCNKHWRDIPLLENVNCVIFKKQHINIMVCNSCRCLILDNLKNNLDTTKPV